jgi:hypothetical protein
MAIAASYTGRELTVIAPATTAATIPAMNSTYVLRIKSIRVSALACDTGCNVCPLAKVLGELLFEFQGIIFSLKDMTI